jgi:hypothetical protein
MTEGRSWRRRLGRFALTRANLFGLAFAVTAGVLGAFGLMGGFWPIGIVGAYTIGALIAPHESGHRIDVARAREARDVRAALDEVYDQARRHTEPEVVESIGQVRREILTLASRLTDDEPIQSNWETIRQVALDYLPTTLENYLNIPNVYRRRVRRQDGSTAHDELLDQLRLLKEKMGEIIDDAGTGRLEGLVEHGQFLKTRFADPITW